MENFTVIGLDPGPEFSAYCALDEKGYPVFWCKKDNSAVRTSLIALQCEAVLCIEMIASYGMAVGKEVFETCVWIGRFIEVWGVGFERITRNEIKNHLCHSSKANDSNIRAALIDLYGPGKDVAIGNKKNPGPLYGMRADEWSALAVARTWFDRRREE